MSEEFVIKDTKILEMKILQLLKTNRDMIGDSENFFVLNIPGHKIDVCSEYVKYNSIVLENKGIINKCINYCKTKGNQGGARIKTNKPTINDLVSDLI